jgi:hypothetical protein
MGFSSLVICCCDWSCLLYYATTLLPMRNVKIQWLCLVLMSVVFFFPPQADLRAQCPMCKMSAESNLRDGGTEGKGLNTGILYMFTLPYLLVGTLGFLWYKNRKGHEFSDKGE